jgi:DNA-binding NarL/FixJ family response regulator
VRHLLPIEQLVRYEAIGLFVERAKAVASNFELTRQNAPAVARVCQRLDGIPLTIELAEARTRVLSTREVEVRVLVAEGLTDPQVADRLYLSPRTVGQHLRSI